MKLEPNKSGVQKIENQIIIIPAPILTCKGGESKLKIINKPVNGIKFFKTNTVKEIKLIKN